MISFSRNSQSENSKTKVYYFYSMASTSINSHVSIFFLKQTIPPTHKTVSTNQYQPHYKIQPTVNNQKYFRPDGYANEQIKRLIL